MRNDNFVNIVEEFDDSYASFPEPALQIESMLQCLSDSSARSKLLCDLLRIDGERQAWTIAWFKNRWKQFASQLNENDLQVEFLRNLFFDQLELNQKPSWKLFSTSKLSAETLLLKKRGDPVYLGQVIFDDWLVTKYLGRGSFGTVYRVKEIDGSRFAALKISDPRVAESKTLLAEESKVLDQIRATGIPEHFGFWEEPEYSALLMELVEGQSVRQLLGEATGTKNLIGVIRDAAKIIDRLHRAGRLHRDIKPDHVVVTDSGQVFVLDYGLAIFEDNLSSAEYPGAGTRVYSSPEQILGIPESMDSRADVYSLGVVLYEVATGKAFSDEESKEAALVRSMLGQKEMSAWPEDADPQLKAIVNKCLDPFTLNRWNSAGELAGALDRLLNAATDETNAAESLLLPWQIGVMVGGVEFGLLTAISLVAQAESMSLPRESINHLRDAVGQAHGSLIFFGEIIKAAKAIDVSIVLQSTRDKFRNLFYGMQDPSILDSVNVTSLLKLAGNEVDQASELLRARFRSFSTGHDGLFVLGRLLKKSVGLKLDVHQMTKMASGLKIPENLMRLDSLTKDGVLDASTFRDLDRTVSRYLKAKSNVSNN